jgi:hypothetical protein
MAPATAGETNGAEPYSLTNYANYCGKGEA